VVVQVALAFVLVVGAGLLLYSLGRLRDVPLGIRAQDVLAFELHLPDARYDSTARASFYEAFARRAEQLPGVRAAGGISKLPATGNYHTWGTRAVTGPYVGDRRHRGAFDQRVIAGDYFRAVGIPLLAGRVFDDRDVPDAPQHVIVSASAAKTLFGAANPIGQRLNTGGREAEVIGVVGDAAVNNEGRVVPYVYHAHRQFAGDRNWALAQVVATNDPNSAVGPIRALLASLDGRLVLLRPAPLDEVIGRGASERLFTMRRSGMILRQGLMLTAIGLGVGLLGAAALSRVVASLLFQVRPMDVTVLAGASVVMALVSGIAAYAPARRATSIDPRDALS
jgi:hypothetical protein